MPVLRTRTDQYGSCRVVGSVVLTFMSLLCRFAFVSSLVCCFRLLVLSAVFSGLVSTLTCGLGSLHVLRWMSCPLSSCPPSAFGRLVGAGVGHPVCRPPRRISNRASRDKPPPRTDLYGPFWIIADLSSRPCVGHLESTLLSASCLLRLVSAVLSSVVSALLSAPCLLRLLSALLSAPCLLRLVAQKLRGCHAVRPFDRATNAPIHPSIRRRMSSHGFRCRPRRISNRASRDKPPPRTDLCGPFVDHSGPVFSAVCRPSCVGPLVCAAPLTFCVGCLVGCLLGPGVDRLFSYALSGPRSASRSIR